MPRRFANVSQHRRRDRHSEIRRRRKLSSAQNGAELAPWLAIGACDAGGAEMRPRLFLFGQARRVCGLEKWPTSHHPVAPNVGSAIRNVSHCGENFRRASRSRGGRFLPIRWRMFADDLVETRYARDGFVHEIAE